ncbi:MAG TPA: S8 family serine peptidase, partial [Verrucomicrobiae bacterium]|nr:S8 family serine peptidase [Verrucomicrobiae bacterium]
MNARIAIVAALVLSSGGCALRGSSTLPAGGVASPAMTARHSARLARVCPDTPPGFSHCDSWMRTDVLGGRAGAYHGSDLARARRLSAASFEGYGPADFQAAYEMPSKTAGTGQTVAIVDAYDDKTAAADLATYRSDFNLSACTKANGCLRIVNQKGQSSPLPAVDASGEWTFETSLDLDMISALCPNCRILLVEATSDANANLAASVVTAVKLGASVVSNSYGGPEYEASDPSYTFPGKAILTVSAGDYDLNPQTPASLSTVVAVGGTRLVKGGGGKRGWSESVWNDPADGVGTASGCSNWVGKPAWQKDKGCATRASNDIAASADCSYYALIYDGSPYNGKRLGWTGACGTSESSPLVAAAYALAGNAKSVSKTYAESIYEHGGTRALYDVVVGNNWYGAPCP